MIYGFKNYCLFGFMGVGIIFGWVYFGKRMVGQYGVFQVIVCCLIVVWVDVEQNLLIIKGVLFGKFGILLNIIFVKIVGWG